MSLEVEILYEFNVYHQMAPLLCIKRKNIKTGK